MADNDVLERYVAVTLIPDVGDMDERFFAIVCIDLLYFMNSFARLPEVVRSRLRVDVRRVFRSLRRMTTARSIAAAVTFVDGIVVEDGADYIELIANLRNHCMRKLDERERQLEAAHQLIPQEGIDFTQNINDTLLSEIFSLLDVKSLLMASEACR
ncbi:hypothetical protein L2E82_02505 [Cichorium intybus]|uniref:Uncharacterized protein n=1 Tax=Cichorium intybus TaxID=13427 RepID=A0ACB9H3Z7_CICIN|nr:hypothetical protein L2E82_02505 [Cichorium intybus]